MQLVVANYNSNIFRLCLLCSSCSPSINYSSNDTKHALCNIGFHRYLRFSLAKIIHTIYISVKEQ